MQGPGGSLLQRAAQRIIPDHNLGQRAQLAGNLVDAGTVLSVGEDHLGLRQPQSVQQEVALVRGIHRRAHRADASRTQPEVDPFRAGGGVERDAIAATDTQIGEHARRGTGPLPHLLECHLDAGDRHHHPVGILLGTAIQHGRHGEPVDAEVGGPQRREGHQAFAATGSGSPAAV